MLLKSPREQIGGTAWGECYTMSRPWVYSPPPRQEGLSEEPSTGGWGEGQINDVKPRGKGQLWDSFTPSFFVCKGLLWALISWRGGEQLKVAPETPCFIRRNGRKKGDFWLWCHHWGLQQQSDSHRELSWESWSGPSDIQDCKGWDELASERTFRLARSYLVFFPSRQWFSTWDHQVSNTSFLWELIRHVNVYPHPRST